MQPDLRGLYGFTYTIHKNDPLPSDYEPVVQLLKTRGDLVELVYEDLSKKGKQVKLHIHGAVRFQRRNPLFKSMVPNGFHSKFESIYDMDGWHKYCIKNENKQVINNKEYLFDL